MFSNTFDQIAHNYNVTKPVISKYSDRSDDVRPIGDRRRKWERIVKISDTKYALLCGNYDPMLWHEGHVNKQDYPPLEGANLEAVAPLVYERGRKYDYVTLRNSHWRQANAVYEFLSRWTPQGMYFQIGNGKQYISVPSANTKHYIAHTNWIGSHASSHTPENDMYLKYRLERDRAGASWELCSKPHTEYTNSTKVDKSEKAKLKPFLQELYGQMLALGNMLPREKLIQVETRWGPQTQRNRDDINAFIKRYVDEVTEYAGSRMTTNWYGSLYRLESYFAQNPDETKRIIAESDHPLRMALITTMWYSKNIELLDLTDPDEFKKAKSRMNSAVNKLCGLVSKTKVKTQTN